MEEEGKEKKGMTFLCLVRNENKKKNGRENVFLEFITVFFSPKITLIPLKSLDFFVK